MAVNTTDKSRAAFARYDEASMKGLANAADLLTAEVKKAHGSWYYRGGKYRNSVMVRASIHYLTPYKTATGWETQVGTDKIIALYWELGWTNKHSGIRYHVPIWKPTAEANVERMKDAYNRVVARLMEAP